MAMCTNCGKPLEAGVKFCGSCGAPVKGGGAAASAGGASRLPWVIAAIFGVLALMLVLWLINGRGSDGDVPAIVPVPTLAEMAATDVPSTAVPVAPTDEPTAEPTSEPTTEEPTALPPTSVPQPTAPPPPTATPEPTVAPVSIEFYPENGQFVIPKGQLCTALNWRTTGVTEVHLQREGGERNAVEPSGRQGDICFKDGELLYTLSFKMPDGSDNNRTVKLERE